ncbi:MAG: EAL domain-containing protein [Burkholderiaceae bacterium]|nr:EAL domain-containing protein [Burkholderiaceae bacterium]
MSATEPFDAQAELARFRLLANNLPVLIAVYEASTSACLFANRQYADAFGWTETSLLGRHFAEVIGPEAAAAIQPHVDVLLRTGEPVLYERRAPAGNGLGERWIEVNLLPQLDDDGTVLATFVLISDITRHRRAERAARESEERLGKFMQASLEGIVFHRDGLITDANPPACELLGHTLEELLGRSTLSFIAPEAVHKVQQVIRSREETRYESVLLHKSGAHIPVEFIVRSMMFGGELQRMTIIRDLRDRLEAQARIHHLAHHDALTGLPNRMAFMEHLQRCCAEALAHGETLAMLFLDLDNFKRVNDSLGHLEGDVLLRTVAQRLTGALRSTDRVARFGGDEFVLLLRPVLGRDQVDGVARRLLADVEHPVMAGGRPLSVTPSIGIALFPEQASGPEQLIQRADMAMYQAKALGRANHQFFDSATAALALDELVLESQLSHGLSHDEFVLHFQPQLQIADGRLVGAEALIRWQHPTRGLLTPESFIGVAEQLRLMLPLGEWILREAARCARRWHDNGLAAVPVAVNLSSMQFRLEGFAASVARILVEEGVPGEWLELELTERMLMDDLPLMRKTLIELKALGLQISVDDFGTGHTLLSHLTQLPIDKLKVDRQFVEALPDDAGALAITRAIVQMARGLGFTVIAEGVQNRAQQELLAQWGCQQIQGLALGGPLPVAEFEAWVAQRVWPVLS